MTRYVAFLRGVSPMNARMPDLARAFEAAGFSDVRTLLSSGNVAFTAPAGPADVLESRAEVAMHAELGRSFRAIVRPTAYLQDLLAADPLAEFEVPAAARCVVTFLRRPLDAPVTLPVERGGARILKLAGAEAFTVYVPGPKGPAFMALLERTFGTEITTRTLETVARCARA